MKDKAGKVKVQYEAGDRVANLDLLGFQLDGVSWQALEAEHPALAGALQEVVNNGHGPQQVRQYVMQRGPRSNGLAG